MWSLKTNIESEFIMNEGRSERILQTQQLPWAWNKNIRKYQNLSVLKQLILYFSGTKKKP